MRCFRSTRWPSFAASLAPDGSRRQAGVVFGGALMAVNPSAYGFFFEDEASTPLALAAGRSHASAIPTRLSG
jgi:hypothetical protein